MGFRGGAFNSCNRDKTSKNKADNGDGFSSSPVHVVTDMKIKMKTQIWIYDAMYIDAIIDLTTLYTVTIDISFYHFFVDSLFSLDEELRACAIWKRIPIYINDINAHISSLEAKLQ